MITLVDIKEAIREKLEPLDIKIYGNEIEEGYNRPCFFTQILPVGGLEQYSRNLVENNFMIEIVYFSKEETQLDNLKMSDTLRNIFFPFFNVETRKIRVTEFKQDTSNNILSLRFYINFYDWISKEEETELMKKLKLEMNGVI
ncbi:MAG: phage tail terminator family protein [Sarcina sp.]